MKQELKNLMRLLPDHVDGAIITSSANRRYFTGMRSSAGTLLLTRHAAQFIIDFRYIEKARQVITDFDVLLQENLYAQIAEFFTAQNAKTIAIESDTLTVAEFADFTEKLPDFQILGDGAMSRVIERLRAIKSEEEIAAIQKAQDITDACFTHILDYIKPGVTELEIAAEMEFFMKKAGSLTLAFDTIAVSGYKSSMPHGVPGEKKIETGDFLTMDFGAAWEGYCSDMTRTVAIGKISEEQKRVYDTVLEAQKRSMEAIAVGKRYDAVDRVARDYIDAQGYVGCFGHGLGHSLGLDIHENPRFSPSCSEIIEPGVVISVEPGVYLAGKFGVRIEDIVLIRENDIYDFTKSEKKLITL